MPRHLHVTAPHHGPRVGSVGRPLRFPRSCDRSRPKPGWSSGEGAEEVPRPREGGPVRCVDEPHPL
eukprot:6258078-Alexandrium_andersonii.AAC.1